MRNVWMIIKKELTRFFTDKRMLISIFLPGVLIYFLYSFMGSAMNDAFVTEDSYEYAIAVCNPSNSVANILASTPVKVYNVEGQDLEEAKRLVASGAQDLLVVFPKNFDKDVAAYVTGEGNAPHVQIYYNSADTASSEAYGVMVAVLDGYESLLSNKFDINADGGMYDLATDESFTTMLFSMLLPLLLMTFMYSGCMAVAPESIAGEKERGTIATLLVTPVKRSQLAIGKIISLSMIALSGGLVSFIGVMLSLPKLVGEMESVNAAVYGALDYALILAVIVTTILVFVAAISIISAFANSVKEASSYLSVMMVFVMLASVSTMFGAGSIGGVGAYFIPVFNSVQCFSGIFNKDYAITNVLVALASNTVYAGVMIYILTGMFNSERIMFRR